MNETVKVYIKNWSIKVCIKMNKSIKVCIKDEWNYKNMYKGWIKVLSM